ncbi:hypothetical protein NECID01_1776 [Nematocida sp. AWRm77]|nr:hypothetical protein NECID01_1776 [Nematocida sp. AWRm77]
MIHSMWYLENLDMCSETRMIIEEKEKEETVVHMVGEVEFDIDNGPSVKVPPNLSVEEEEELAFSSLPDIRSQSLCRESFVFSNRKGYFHVSFVQEKSDAVKRGYTQKSVFVCCSALVPALPRMLSSVLANAAMYTAATVEEKLQHIDIQSLSGGRNVPSPAPESVPSPSGVFAKLLKQNRKIIFENFIRCKSFLVLGESPTEVSEAVCALAYMGGFFYGGTVLPYSSSFVKCTEKKHVIIGGTNEHTFDQNEFDNVLVLTQERFLTKFPKYSKEAETFFALFEQYFAADPFGFKIPQFMEQLSAQCASLRIKRLFCEFFSGKNFISWLSSAGYQLKED